MKNNKIEKLQNKIDKNTDRIRWDVNNKPLPHIA
jgi:hypothetical protein